MKTFISTIAFVIFVGAYAYLGAVALGHVAGSLKFLPQCQEDQVLVGQSEFDNGRWTNYICGPAVDDFVGE